jgi:uncharacterized protein YyaL (SSP411 family)
VVNCGAIPSGNAVALHALARLSRRPGGKDEFLQTSELATKLLAVFASTINREPANFPYMVMAVGVLHDGQSGAQQYAAHGGASIASNCKPGGISVEPV